MSDIVVLDNVLPESFAHQVREWTMDGGVQWFYHYDLTYGNKDDAINLFAGRYSLDIHFAFSPGFSHALFDNGESQSNLWSDIHPIVWFLSEKLDNKALTAFSVKMNMQLQRSTKNYLSCNYPHQDQLEHQDTWIFLYYVNDSDGDTIIFDGVGPPDLTIRERIRPKANTGVFFSNKFWHASSNPIGYNRRVNINFNLLEL